MNDIQAATQLLALREFAEVTREKLRELQAYTELGILGEDIYNSMEDVIKSRIEFTDAKMKEIFEAMDKGY